MKNDADWKVANETREYNSESNVAMHTQLNIPLWIDQAQCSDKVE